MVNHKLLVHGYVLLGNSDQNANSHPLNDGGNE